MTNQEAAEMIRNDMKLHHGYLSGTYRKALNMAISALQAQEVKQEAKDSTESSLTQKALDTISRQAAIDEIRKCRFVVDAIEKISGLSSAQPESCDECKHLGKWENEVEYGYPSPCTNCKRRARDHYER